MLKLVYSMNALLRSDNPNAAELVEEASFDQETFIAATLSRGYIKEPPMHALIVSDISMCLASDEHCMEVMQHLAAHAYAHGFLRLVARDSHDSIVPFLLSQSFTPVTSTEMCRDAVLPCPFCGTPPTKVATQEGSRGFSCTNEDCVTKRSLFIGGFSHIFDSVQAWNTRYREVELPFATTEAVTASTEDTSSSPLQEHMDQPPTPPTNGSSNSQSGILPIRRAG